MGFNDPGDSPGASGLIVVLTILLVGFILWACVVVALGF